MDDILNKLSKSQFRSRFKLNAKDKAYIKEKGLETIKQHAVDFVEKRIAPANIINDGKQTPMCNHPVFKAQHATATCCRKCINKWHGFPLNTVLNDVQKEYIVNLIMCWIQKQIDE